MPELRFEWDPVKERANFRKHGVDFEEAKLVFEDEHGLLIHDPDHSEDEDRFILLGRSRVVRLLVVVHCYREPSGTIRLISARKATRSERGQYEGRWNK